MATAASTTTSRIELAQGLLAEYVTAVEQRDLARWVDLFASVSAYEVISRENVERGHPVAHILDDSKDRIRDRAVYVEQVWAGSYDEYYPRHLVSNTRAHVRDEGDVELASSLAVYVTELWSGQSSLLAVGAYEDRVVFEDGEPRFVHKRVVLDTSVLPRYFVYPL